MTSTRNYALRQTTNHYNNTPRQNQTQTTKLRSKSVAIMKSKFLADKQNLVKSIKKQVKAEYQNRRLNQNNRNSSKQKKQRIYELERRNSKIQHERTLYTSHESQLLNLYRFQIMTDDKNNDKAQNNMHKPIQRNIISFSTNQNSFLTLDSSKKITFENGLAGNKSELQSCIQEHFKRNNIQVKEVFCTPYSNFVVDCHEKLYGYGLNDRGQLGISQLGLIKLPQHIILPLNKYTNDLKDNPLGNQSNPREFIAKIAGGPFHTAILTSFKRVFYSGIVYRQSQLQKDRFVNKFTLLNIKSKIDDIQCGLTSLIMRTQDNQLLLMGLFGQKIFFDVPTDIQLAQKSTIRKICICEDSIYYTNEKGKLYKINMNKRIPHIVQIRFEHQSEEHATGNKMQEKQLKPQVIELHSSNNQTVFVVRFYDDAGKQTVSSFKYYIQSSQQSQTTIGNSYQEIKLSKPWGKIQPSKVFSVSNHLYILFDQKSQLSIQGMRNKQSQNEHPPIQNLQPNVDFFTKRIKQLEEQNLNLRKINKSSSNLNILKTQKQENKKADQFLTSNINFHFESHINPRTFFNDFQIEFKQIKIGKKIAEGGYGVIYQGEWKKTQVAVKIFKIDQNNPNQIKQFVSQCHAMEVLRHPNIVMFLGICLKKPNFSIVLQYCEGGTLWSKLQNHKIQISWKEKLSYSLQIAKAMNYLHDRKNPIVHRDLKSLNILFDANNRIKLADFGWTKTLQNYMTSKIGTYQWMAPEVLKGQEYTEKADIFSYAIILWEIAARQPPYRNLNGIQVAHDVANKQLRPMIPKNTPQGFEKLIVSCWDKDPLERPSSGEIIQILQMLLKAQS